MPDTDGRNDHKPRHRALVLHLCVFVLGSFAFGFALVPLYDAFCRVIGVDDRAALTTPSVISAATPRLTITSPQFLPNNRISFRISFRMCHSLGRIHVFSFG